MKNFLKNGFLHVCLLFLAVVATCACYLVALVLRLLWDAAYHRWWYIFEVYGMHLLGFAFGIVSFWLWFFRKWREIPDARPE